MAEARANLQAALELFFESASEAEIERRSRSEVNLSRVEIAVG